MMTYRIAAAVFAAACLAALPAEVRAQQGFGPSVEASLGIYRGRGGNFAERGGPVLDAVLTVPMRRQSAGSVVAGIATGVTGPLASDLVCAVGPAGECVPDYPTFLSVAVVGGVQRRIIGGNSARLLAGPAFHQAADGGAALGLQVRGDVARPLFFRTALVASLRGDLLPRYQGDRLGFAAFGLGLRIQ